jgi:hypothetical protein
MERGGGINGIERTKAYKQEKSEERDGNVRQDFVRIINRVKKIKSRGALNL